MTASVSASSLFRVVEALAPTLLIDEVDTFLRDHDDLRGILNAGQTRSGSLAMRTNRETSEVEFFACFAAVALGAIGGLPGTIKDRAIVVCMKRARSKSVPKLRRVDREALEREKPRLARWALDNIAALREARPHLPDDLNDRADDGWEPLIAIADRAGGTWPEKARRAAVALSGEAAAAEDEDEDLAMELLRDLRGLLETIEPGDPYVASDVAVGFLLKDETRPWKTYGRKGNALTQYDLAKLLRPFGIRSRKYRAGSSETLRGYSVVQIRQAIETYVSCAPPSGAEHAEQGLCEAANRHTEDPEHGRVVPHRTSGVSAHPNAVVPHVPLPSPLLGGRGDVHPTDAIA